MSPSSPRLPAERQPVLLFQVGGAALALPLAGVEEILRPLPLEPLPGVSPNLLGTARVRGRRIPVVALSVRSSGGGHPTRWISVRTGRRRLALAVDGVAGVLRLSREALAPLPPLLTELKPGEKEALARHAPRLLALLRHGWVLQTASAGASPEGEAL